ncbi:MAG: PAS domain S-box protein [Bacteroidales bacterium]|nr:PAS domain S-box protein [Bacteroidales bacterium]
MSNEVFLKHLAEVGDDLIYRYELTPERGFSYVSRSALNFTGYSRDEHYADPDLGFKLVHPDDRHLLERLVENGADSRIVLRWIKKDGTVVWAEQRNVIVYNDKGMAVAIEGIARDVTDKMRAESMLKESEARYRTIFENTGTAIAVFENDGTISLASSSFEELSGYQNDEVLNKMKWMDFVVEEDIEWMMGQHKLRRSDTLAAVKEYEFRLRDKSGEIKYVNIHIDIIPGTTKSIASMIDITERKHAAERLEHSHDLMRYIIEHANSAVAVHDRDLRYIYVSQRYLDAYKVKDRNIIGKHHYEVFPDLPQKWRDVHQEALKGNVTRSDRDNYPKADGSVEWTRWECRPWYEADGSIGGFVIYTEEITEWVEAEDKLRKSEEKYRLMVENQTDLIVKVDPEGRFLFVSPSYCRMFGKSEKDLLGSNFMPSVHKDDRESTSEAMKDLFRPPHTAYIEQRVAGSEGWLWVAWVDTAIPDDQGNIKEIIMVGRDITDRKKAEIELQNKNEELERFNRMMVDRENRMISLKKEVNGLLTELNRTKKYRSPDDVDEADR